MEIIMAKGGNLNASGQDKKIMPGSKTAASASSQSNPPKNTVGQCGSGMFTSPVLGKGKK